MANNWTITVGNPILTTGMSFFVRYRKMTEQNWINFLPNPTTNTFTIPNLDDKFDYEAEISTVCASGDVSLPIYHSTAPAAQCIAPTLSIDIEENVVTYDWNNNGFNYGSGIAGMCVVQISYDNINWIDVANLAPDAGTYTYVMQSVPLDGMNVFFRIINSGSGCVQESNTVTIVWNDNQNEIKLHYIETIPTTCSKTSQKDYFVLCSGTKQVNFGILLGVSGFVRLIGAGPSITTTTDIPAMVVNPTGTPIGFSIFTHSYNMGTGGPVQLSNTNYAERIFNFEFSPNGNTGWVPFDLIMKAQ